MEKVKQAVTGLLRAMQKRADAETAAGIGQLIDAVEKFEPCVKAA
jgi:hypothetical protein